MKIFSMILVIAIFVIANIFLIILMQDKIREYSNYKDVITSKDTEIAKGITKETAEKRAKTCIQNVSIIIISIICITIITIMTLYAVNIDFKTSNTDNLDINNKIERGYEVYLDYGYGRDKTKLDNYIYNSNDNLVFEIEINDNEKEIVLKLDNN